MNSSGYSTLLSVIIVSAISISIVSSMLLLSLDNSRANAVNQRAIELSEAADACAALVLGRLKANVNYTGDEALAVLDLSCQVGQIGGSGNNDRTLEIEISQDNVYRRLRIEVAQLSPDVEISSWRKVADF